jgi:glycosyltransferase involved in cell wall biosynthesis
MNASPEATMELTILMPCLNEAKTLGSCIKKATKFLQEYGINGEVLIADNGSTDGSQQIALALGARVIEVKNKGYGNALMGGINSARGKFIIMADSDDSYDLYNLLPFVQKLRQGFHLVMGNRFKGEIKPGAMPFLHKYLGNPFLSWLGRLFFGAKVGDFLCGIRAFEREAILKLELQTTGMEFGPEMVIKASLAGLKITEIPTVLSPDGRSRPPHLKTWRDGWRNLRFMLLYSPSWLFLYPGIILMLIGLILGGWIWIKPRKVFSVTLDIHTLTFCALAVMIGFQAVFFSIFARVFALRAGLLIEAHTKKLWIQNISLELFLILGGFLAIVGLFLAIGAFISWQTAGFGPLNPSYTMRIVIPSFLSIGLGTQIILSSFFISFLNLPKKKL